MKSFRTEKRQAKILSVIRHRQPSLRIVFENIWDPHNVSAVPMFGMVQSLNVSVACAIIIYEAVRQRRKAGLYDIAALDENEMDELLEKWNRI